MQEAEFEYLEDTYFTLTLDNGKEIDLQANGRYEKLT